MVFQVLRLVKTTKKAKWERKQKWPKNWSHWCLEVKQVRKQQQWWPKGESSEAEGKQEHGRILKVWKLRNQEAVNHHSCWSGRKAEDRWKNDSCLWQRQGDWWPCSEWFREMWTKVQWVRGFQREWERDFKEEHRQLSSGLVLYSCGKEVRLRGFYFKMGEIAAPLHAKGNKVWLKS